MQNTKPDNVKQCIDTARSLHYLCDIDQKLLGICGSLYAVCPPARRTDREKKISDLLDAVAAEVLDWKLAIVADLKK